MFLINWCWWWWREQCVSRKKLLFVMQNLGIWGLTGTGVKMRGRKCHIWNRRPWFTYSLCNFYGATMMIKGNLLLSAPIVKHFGRRWSDSRRPLLPAAGSQYTAVKPPIVTTSVRTAVFQPWHRPTIVLQLVYCPVDSTLFEVSTCRKLEYSCCAHNYFI